MISMKEQPPPPLSRRKNPTAAVDKLNLLCSFNGAFRPTSPSGALRYFGGETRIVSVDRNFALSKLRSKIADLSPAIASFVVKYQLSVISASAAAAAPLLLLDSDDDVRRMFDAFEKLESCGESARLRLFVCSINTANGLGSGHRAGSEARGPGELGETKKCEPLLIDLDTDCDNVARVSVARCNALNPRDGNVRVDQGLGKVVCNGVGVNDQAMQGLKLVSCSGVKPGCNGFDVKNGMDGNGNVNRENNVSVVRNGLSCDSMVDAGDRVCGGLDGSIRDLRFGGSDGRHQRCIPVVCVRNHRGSVAEMGNHRSVRLDGRLSTRKGCIGRRPHTSIGKQGQAVRVYYPNSWRQYGGFSEYAVAERVKVLNSSSIKDSSLSGVQRSDQKQSEENGPGRLQHMNVNLEEYCLGYYGEFTAVGDQSHLNCDVTENLFPSARTMHTQENLVTMSGFGKCEGQYQTSYETVHGVIRKCESIHSDPDKETCLTNIVNGLNTYGASGSKLGSNNIQDSNNGVTCSVNISLRNLSLSKEVEGPQLSIHASCVMTSDALLKPQSELTDVMDEGQFISGPQVKESNRVASEQSFQNSAKIEKGSEHIDEDIEESSSSLTFTEQANHGESFNCSKVIGGTSIDLAAFYTHLATRDMQTIKNSDLEFIKELGSGTYGTVYHGKWKGSNVAIKKIKPSCFTDGVLEDRLLADFWKEAHILGQLHHPNIVAFYGVVTDGPVTDLATVTEYMVNGSLQQVLRRKDRTIDRRKRLILAMDAAFGMEYLHEKSIVHFDLKSHNFLVNMKDPHRPVCKIGDLGLSKIKQRTLVSGGVRGTVPWMAPELLNSNSKNNLVTEKVDVYSFGIVMWELLTGEEPYANLRSEEIIAGIIKGNLRPEIPSWCDPTWRSLMERCWSSDPKSRPPFSEISKELRAVSSAMNIN